MRLPEDEARARLAAHDHGILCTVHAERGVDAVPVAYAVDEDGYVGVPVDLVKPKASSRLQRERNLEADPRATLLVEHWDRGDWSRLWWVRARIALARRRRRRSGGGPGRPVGRALPAVPGPALRPGAGAAHRRHYRLGRRQLTRARRRRGRTPTAAMPQRCGVQAIDGVTIHREDRVQRGRELVVRECASRPPAHDPVRPDQHRALAVMP